MQQRLMPLASNDPGYGRRTLSHSGAKITTAHEKRRAVDLISKACNFIGLSWFYDAFLSSGTRRNASPPLDPLSTAVREDVGILKIWLYWIFKICIIYFVTIWCLGLLYRRAIYKLDTSKMCSSWVHLIIPSIICTPDHQQLAPSSSNLEVIASAREKVGIGLLIAGQSYYLNQDTIDISWYMRDLKSDIITSDLQGKDQLACHLGSMIDTMTNLSR